MRPALESALWRFGRPLAIVLVGVWIILMFTDPGKTSQAPPDSTLPCTMAAQGPHTTSGDAALDEYREQQAEDFVGQGCRMNP